MKRIVLLVSIIGLTINSYSQISEGGLPFSSKYNLRSDIPAIELPKFNIEEQKKIDDENNAFGGKAYRFAKSFDMDADITNSGLWETLPNGDKLWRLEIFSEKAKSLNIIFEEYVLPEGAKVFLYNPDKSFILGAFTAKNNKKSKILPTELIPGDKVIVEYYEPKNAEFEGLLKIGRVGHDYRGLIKKDNQFGASGACNVDINCPDGSSWQDEKRGICRMIINSTDLCTGGLIANVKKDNEPYFLTANHCISTDNLADRTIYYFNYESPTCNGSDGSTSKTISGSELKATTPNLDFALVSLSSNPPENYDPYFLGWDVRAEHETGAVCIHHPNGDVKKIAIDDDKLTVVSFEDDYDPLTHWLIGEWEIGTTEGGSSGAPLFNMGHRIIGDLTGGYATCSNPVKDYYARISNSWDDYSDPANQLKAWLDPDNTGTQYMDGYDPNVSAGEVTGCIAIHNIEPRSSIYVWSTGDNGENGYVTGNNAFKDKVKAEYFSAEKYGTKTVIDAVYFEFAVAKGSFQPITFGIWNQVDGKPGTMIGSATVPLPDITTNVANEELTYVDFDPYIEIPGPFYAGVVLPQNAGDTLAIWAAEVTGETSWEQWENGAWSSLYDAWSNPDVGNFLQIGFTITPIVCEVSTAIPELNRLDDELVNLYPNPSQGKFNIDVSLINNQDFTVQVFSTLGNNILTIEKPKFESNVEIDLSNHISGLYLVNIILDDGNRIVKKIILSE